jgi:asparagine synthase (glutamine-hydrolysing)
MTVFVDFLSRGRPRFAHAGNTDNPAITDREAWERAFEHGAVSAASSVTGPFSVVLRHKSGQVFMAVDRFGLQSLCYAVRDGRLQVATRADEIAGTKPELSAQAIFDYLYFHAIPSPRTIFEGVFRLPPGHCATFEDGQLTVVPYWQPTFEPDAAPTFEARRDEFRSLLREAVRAELDGGKPGCYLSGGTDSSTVAGMIGEVAGKPAATYSIGFDAAGYDEMAFARIAARHFGTEHHEYYVTPADLVSAIPNVAGSYDQPFGNSSAVPAYYCARMAREDGVSRLLAGDGGDELFGGNTRYATQRIFGWYDRVPSPLRTLVLQPLFAQGPLAAIPGVRKVGSYINQARVPLRDRLQTYNLLQRLGIREVLSANLLARVDVLDPSAQQRRIWAQPDTPHQIDRNLAFDWRYTLAENDLPKVCGSAALAGMEVGFPLLDQRLVDFSSRLPPSYKLRGLKLRWFFKEALRGFLPDEIITKKKQGFGLPFGVWTASNPALFEFARESLAGFSARGIVRPEFIEDLLNRRLHEHPGYYGEMIWILMMLEQWMRRHAPDWRLQA